MVKLVDRQDLLNSNSQTLFLEIFRVGPFNFLAILTMWLLLCLSLFSRSSLLSTGSLIWDSNFRYMANRAAHAHSPFSHFLEVLVQYIEIDVDLSHLACKESVISLNYARYFVKDWFFNTILGQKARWHWQERWWAFKLPFPDALAEGERQHHQVVHGYQELKVEGPGQQASAYHLATISWPLSSLQTAVISCSPSSGINVERVCRWLCSNLGQLADATKIHSGRIRQDSVGCRKTVWNCTL